jgi:hypothetical protein
MRGQRAVPKKKAKRVGQAGAAEWRRWGRGVADGGDGAPRQGLGTR